MKIYLNIEKTKNDYVVSNLAFYNHKGKTCIDIIDCDNTDFVKCYHSGDNMFTISQANNFKIIEYINPFEYAGIRELNVSEEELYNIIKECNCQLFSIGVKYIGSESDRQSDYQKRLINNLSLRIGDHIVKYDSRKIDIIF